MPGRRPCLRALQDRQLERLGFRVYRRHVGFGCRVLVGFGRVSSEFLFLAFWPSLPCPALPCCPASSALPAQRCLALFVPWPALAPALACPALLPCPLPSALPSALARPCREPWLDNRVCRFFGMAAVQDRQTPFQWPREAGLLKPKMFSVFVFCNHVLVAGPPKLSNTYLLFVIRSRL